MRLLEAAQGMRYDSDFRGIVEVPSSAKTVHFRESRDKYYQKPHRKTRYSTFNSQVCNTTPRWEMSDRPWNEALTLTPTFLCKYNRVFISKFRFPPPTSHEPHRSNCKLMSMLDELGFSHMSFVLGLIRKLAENMYKYLPIER
jgi:hypothetical protein